MSEWITEKSDIKESKIEERTGLKPGIVWIKDKDKPFEKNICLYDCNSANFHLLPDLDSEDAKDVKDALDGYYEVVKDVQKNLAKMIACRLLRRPKQGNGTLSKEQYPLKYKECGIVDHGYYRYISISDGQRCYTINFMRWYVDKEKKVNCRFGEIQFETTKNINMCVNTARYKKTKAKEKDIIRYPESYIGQSEKMIRLDGEDQVCVYNPKDVGDIWEIAEGKVVDEFVKFIEKIREREYIVQKSLLFYQYQYYLRLDRASQWLEVYEQADSNTLRELYPLRENFDTSDYVLFTLKKSIPCIFGGEGKTRTPSGIFRIEHISKLQEEYVSCYHPQYDQVKFFGYLEVFEDYFIHSDMYLPDATGDTFRQMKPISAQDAHTSGCIRIPQEELDWLVEHIAEGTVIEM